MWGATGPAGHDVIDCNWFTVTDTCCSQGDSTGNGLGTVEMSILCYLIGKVEQRFA
jgi:hypothetical protein